MTQLAHKSAPLLVTVALVAWCCWSQLHESAPLLASMDEAKLPRIQRRALLPEISEPSQRDPFQPPKPEPVRPVGTASVGPVSENSPESRAVLSTFRLDATMVGTDSPIAMINGQVYGVGDRIALKDLPEVDCRLKRVRAERVVLEIDKEEFEIVYARTSTTPQLRTKEPRKVWANQAQLDLTAHPAGKKGTYTKLLRLLRSTVPDLGADLDPLRDESPLPPPALIEIDSPTSNKRNRSRL